MYPSDTYTNNKCTDITLHPFRKAVSLLMKGNPTMLELLALPTDHYVHISNEGKELIKHGPTLFLSQKSSHRIKAAFTLTKKGRQIYQRA